MKGAIRAHNPGNRKMKGKRFAVLQCGCCVMINHKVKYFTQLQKKEISTYNYEALQTP